MLDEKRHNQGARKVTDVVLYTSDDGQTRLDLRVDGQTVWLTQLEIAELFQTTKQNVSLHANNIFKEGELLLDSVVKESLTTATDGKNYRTKIYNLDLISSGDSDFIALNTLLAQIPL